MTAEPTTPAAAPAPTHVRWVRDGVEVWADEDGVHLSIPGKRSFEMPEAIAICELYQAVLAQYRADIPFTKPTSQPLGRAHFHSNQYVAQRAARAAQRAIAAEFGDTDTPF